MINKADIPKWVEVEIRADERAKVLDEVKMLIAERLKMECNLTSCDDCLECCEVTSLMWVDDRLGIPTNNN